MAFAASLNQGEKLSRVVRFHTTGGPEVLTLDDVDVAEPGPGEVRIETRALGLNRAEVMFRTGQYVVDPVFPSLIGYEAAGVIDAVGPQVSGLEVGDAVSVVPAFAMTDYGMHGEVVLAPARAVVKHAAELSWEAAAAAWMQFITAYGGLVDLAAVGQGDVVLINAASSSVGLAAIQVTKMMGGRPIALTRTSAKRDKLLEYGAERVLATSEDDVVAEVAELTSGAGARVIFDPVGGPDFATLTAAAASQGIILLYGALNSDPTPLPVMDVLGKHLTVRGYELFEITNDDEKLTRAVDFVNAGLASGELSPVIDARFVLDDIVQAYRYLEAGGQVGKVVVTVTQ
ncbi:zinc-dependent alcohol dehydrogenase family protein [Mycobacterium sp. Root135]|uniref:zinc-dependent alcohol dehydrogenase family protein n=1 Tax=Mycobacterium sp. Root135 TaxID=1736457 RepID=UPI000A92294C|nr:zinc-dependent alcohol dehydrogenase family protein [Mycobacterium sp. Root135]